MMMLFLAHFLGVLLIKLNRRLKPKHWSGRLSIAEQNFDLKVRIRPSIQLSRLQDWFILNGGFRGFEFRF